jgi:hypothetical protein
MKIPRIVSMLVLIGMAIPLCAPLALADEFNELGQPSAEMVDELANDDVPALAPLPDVSKSLMKADSSTN